MKTLPTIHMNGTSASTLVNGYSDAAQACAEAIEAIRKIEFNARDYYLQGDGAFDAARREMDAHVAAIGAAVMALNAVAEHASNFVK